MARPLALITGAAGAIGAALARRLDRDGWDLHLIDLDAEPLALLADELTGAATCAASDLSSPQACKQALPATPKLDAFVHLAGVFVPDDLDPEKHDVFEEAMQHNATNAYDMAVAVVPRLSDAGRMVFCASLAFDRGVSDHPGYAMSKGAVVGLTRSLSRRLAARGICVNAVAPGIIETKMTTRLVKERGLSAVKDGIPLGRLGQPEDVSGVIAFLMSPDAAYITGQVININGGVVNG